MWLDQPLFGFGLKSFRVRCHQYAPTAEVHLKMGILPYGCSSHPHNYYLEILVEAGLLGGLLILIFYIILIKDFFYYIKKSLKSKDFELYLLFPIIIMIFVEIWPLKSTGSFFTTSNATYFWLLISIFISKKKI
jgi:O-antigen ligase